MPGWIYREPLDLVGFTRIVMNIIFVVLATVLSAVNGDYIVAVANHDLFLGSSSDGSDYLLSKNIELYENLTTVGKSSGAQVVIFPEFGLTPVASADERSDLYPYVEAIPDVDINSPIVPCGESSFTDRPILSRISCAAKSNEVLVLVNMIDTQPCSSETDKNCPADGHYQFNTDVLFDESGAMVAKYHKSHEWPGLMDAYDQPASPSRVTYQSPTIGVEFGLFTCFDIMFQDPPRELVAQGIKHFLYPVQQGLWGDATLLPHWSKQNQAVLIASNVKCGDPTSATKLDFSRVYVSGVEVSGQKVYLDGAIPEFRSENVLIVTVPS